MALTKVISENGECLYDENYIDNPNFYFSILKESLNWRIDQIRIFGKLFDIPRMHAWYGDEDSYYSYSNISLPINPWTKELLFLKQKIEKEFSLRFNGVLCNYYRDGVDSNGWHSDDEKELIRPTHIIGLSFGDNRSMQFRLKGQKKKSVDLELNSGSLIYMKAPHQDFWQHQIPKRKNKKERINLTFRLVEKLK